MRLLIILLLILIPALPLNSHADKASKLNKKGIESYEENNIEESTKFFTEALVERPDSPELRFNRGTVLSTTDKKDEAINELEKAAYTFDSKEHSAAAHFNAGNTFFTAEELNEAIESYKKALKLDQSSKDIRYNLELAVRKLQEQQQQQQQQQQENKDEDKEKEDSEEQQDDKEQEKENEEKDDESENKNNEQKEDQEQQQQNQEQSQQQQSEDQLMTPEETERLLDAIEDEEKKAFSLRREKMRNEMRQGDDW